MKLKEITHILHNHDRMSHSIRRQITVNFSADDIAKFIRAAANNHELTEWSRAWLAIQKDMQNDFSK